MSDWLGCCECELELELYLSILSIVLLGRLLLKCMCVFHLKVELSVIVGRK